MIHYQKNSDLIILDDPISSFDKNKKYAIMDMLFRQDNSFEGKTVLMFAHDIEPIIDSTKILHKIFSNQFLTHFISTKNNIIREQEVKKEDISSCLQICKVIIGDEKINNIIK